MITPTTNVIPKHDPKPLEEAPTIKGAYSSLHQAKEIIYEFWQIFKPRPREMKVSTGDETKRTNKDPNSKIIFS